MAAVVHVALGIHDPKGDFSCHAGAMLASLFCYDAAVTAGASILFDYVW